MSEAAFIEACRDVYREQIVPLRQRIATLEATLAAAQRNLDAEREAHEATRGVLRELNGLMSEARLCVLDDGADVHVSLLRDIDAAMKAAHAALNDPTRPLAGSEE